LAAENQGLLFFASPAQIGAFLNRTLMIAYALTLFTSAFLLFLVQPVIGKYILPWFGGSPAVWTTCMLVFQAGLLGGYTYAHLITRHLSLRRQVLLHGVLVLLSLLFLPLAVGEAWKPSPGDEPVWGIILLLLANIGLPYVVLSATAPLLQSWMGVTHPGRSPWWLYALSNAGSLLALLGYPFVIEVTSTRRVQTLGWSFAFGVFALLCGVCAWSLWRRAPEAGGGPAVGEGAVAAEAAEAPAPSWSRRFLWIALAACGSALLLSTTNKLCQDLAVIPLMWVLPLALYILSFILCFAGERLYSRIGFGSALVSAVGACVWAQQQGVELAIVRQVIVYGGALFAGCMVCHGELFRLRPAPRHLTGFYLAVSTGGALGGLLVAIVAPLVFSGFAEFGWSYCCTLFLFGLVCLADEGGLDGMAWRVLGSLFLTIALLALALGIGWLAPTGAEIASSPLQSIAATLLPVRWWAAALLAVIFLWALPHVGRWRRRGWHLVSSILVFVAFTLCSCLFLEQASKSAVELREQVRNFYGSLALLEYDADDPVERSLLLRHGQITHGFEFLAPDRANLATSYYTARSGVGAALLSHRPGQARNIGVVGLGTGTLAAYGEPTDRWRFYEINPEVVRIARESFYYLAICQAPVEIVLGDARLSLEREAPQAFDLLALDAFSSDSIPVHLLTVEAFAVYLRHLRPDGIIAVHISNRFLDLAPVVAKLQRHHRLASVTVSHFSRSDETWDYGSTWVLLSREDASLRTREITEQLSDLSPSKADPPLWTDDYASIFSIIK
jgi:spermidine synthase